MGRPKGLSLYSILNPGNITCSIERIRHCLVSVVRDKSRPFLSLIVAIVILEVIDPPIGECLGVLFLYSQRCSCWISVLFRHNYKDSDQDSVPYCAQVYFPAEEYIPQPSPMSCIFSATAGIPSGNLVAFAWRVPFEVLPLDQQSSKMM